MTQLRALAYADWRAFVNDWRRVLRSPGRLAMWCAYGGLLGLFLGSRFFFAHGGARIGEGDLVRADYFACALLSLLAVSLANGRGPVGIFRSRVEARFLIGSPIAAPLAIAYLEARAALGQGLRLLLSFIYFIFVFGPRRVGPLGALADLVLFLAAITAAAAVVMSRRLLARPAGIVCTSIGIPLVFVALAPAVRNTVQQIQLPLPAPVRDAILRLLPAGWHPGQVLLAPSPLWTAVLLGIAAGAIGVLASAGRDAYPELYALSIARIDRLELRSARRTTARGVPARAIRAPAGVAIFVWKSVVEFRRRARPVAIVGGALFWCIAGFAAARTIAVHRTALFIALIVIVLNVFLILGVTASIALGGEIRRPLFWLARAGLFERLCALALARIWRPIVTLEVIAAGFAAGGGAPVETLVFALGLPSFVALLAGVGFVAFAFLPGSADARGPVTMLRFCIGLPLFVPPLVLGAVTRMVAGSAAGLSTGTLLALMEAGGLIGIAAWRLDGHVDRLPA